jgi:hypothetical protein
MINQSIKIGTKLITTSGVEVVLIKKTKEFVEFRRLDTGEIFKQNITLNFIGKITNQNENKNSKK